MDRRSFLATLLAGVGAFVAAGKGLAEAKVSVPMERHYTETRGVRHYCEACVRHFVWVKPQMRGNIRVAGYWREIPGRV